MAGSREVRPGVFDRFGYEAGDVVAVPTEQAAKWVGSGLAENVTQPRSIEVEQATREPRGERAVRERVKRRRF